MGSKFQNLQDCSGFWLFELLRNDDIITTTSSRIIIIGVVGIDVISVILRSVKEMVAHSLISWRLIPIVVETVLAQNLKPPNLGFITTVPIFKYQTRILLVVQAASSKRAIPAVVHAHGVTSKSWDFFSVLPALGTTPNALGVGSQIPGMVGVWSCVVLLNSPRNSWLKGTQCFSIHVAFSLKVRQPQNSS